MFSDQYLVTNCQISMNASLIHAIQKGYVLISPVRINALALRVTLVMVQCLELVAFLSPELPCMQVRICVLAYVVMIIYVKEIQIKKL